jgi:hypothetical protein
MAMTVGGDEAGSYTPLPGTDARIIRSSVKVVFVQRESHSAADSFCILSKFEYGFVMSETAHNNNTGANEGRTHRERILLAAYALEQQRVQYTIERLMVEAWERNKQQFGLRGFVDRFPDSDKMLTNLVGDRGLFNQGLLRKVEKSGELLVALTREGREKIGHLLGQAVQQEPELRTRTEVVPISAEQERLLQGLLASTALQKELEDQRAGITFRDCCAFLGVDERTSYAVIIGAPERIGNSLASLLVSIGSKSCTLKDGRSVERKDIEQLIALLEHLGTRFERHFAVLRNRNR